MAPWGLCHPCFLFCIHSLGSVKGVSMPCNPLSPACQSLFSINTNCVKRWKFPIDSRFLFHSDGTHRPIIGEPLGSTKTFLPKGKKLKKSHDLLWKNLPDGFWTFKNICVCVYVCVSLFCMHVCVCAHEYRCLWKPEEGDRFPELNYRHLRCLIWVLGIELRSSARAICVPNH